MKSMTNCNTYFACCLNRDGENSNWGVLHDAASTKINKGLIANVFLVNDSPINQLKQGNLIPLYDQYILANRITSTKKEQAAKPVLSLLPSD